MKVTIDLDKMEWASILNILRTYECTHILNKFEDQLDQYLQNNQPERSKREDYTNEEKLKEITRKCISENLSIYI